MKNQAEIFQALLDGKKICKPNMILNDKYVHLVNGWVCNDLGVQRKRIFDRPQDWEIYQEPTEWYDNIPEGGVLCWVWNDGDEDNKIARIVTSYIENFSMGDGTKVPFVEGDAHWAWQYAEPLTCQEVNKLYRNTLAAL